MALILSGPFFVSTSDDWKTMSAIGLSCDQKVIDVVQRCNDDRQYQHDDECPLQSTFVFWLCFLLMQKFGRKRGRNHYSVIAHTLVIRNRPQFEFHIQGPGGRREASRTRNGGALRA